MADEQKFGSWDADDFTEGGFFDDKDATIKEARVVTFDYAGKSEPVCALAITFRPDDTESDDDDRTEYYKIGELSKFTPSSDGQRYIPNGATQAMNKNAKAALFMRALKDKGFQMSKLAQGISNLEGLHVHVNIVPIPDVKLSDGTTKKDLKVLIVTKIHDTPAANAGGAKSDKPAARKPSAKKAADAPATTTAAPASAGDVNDAAAAKLSELIMGLLMEKGGKMPKTVIPPAVFSGVTDPSLRSECMKLMANQNWLGAGAAERGWELNGGELSFPG